MARKAKKESEVWKREILQAAQSLFASKGYEQTSVSDIMNASGGAKGTFYLFFESKDQLLNALVEQWAQSYADAMTAALSGSGTSFFERFHAIMATIENMSKSTLGLDAFFQSANELMLGRLTKRMTDIFVPQLAGVLASGKEQGVVDVEDPYFYARFIIHGALGALNAGAGGPHQNIPDNLRHLPLAVANLLNIEDPAVLSSKPGR